MALVGEPGPGGERCDALVGTRQPCGHPLQAEAAPVLADALAVLGAEQPREVRRVEADLLRQGGERWRRRQVRRQQVANRREPWLPAGRLPAPGDRRAELEGEALERERRERVLVRQLPADLVREDRRPPVAEAPRAGVGFGLEHHQPGALPTELVLVRLG